MRALRVLRTDYTEVWEGELVNPRIDEEIVPLEPDAFDADDGITAVGKGIAYLLAEGLTSPSSSRPGPRDWMALADGSYVTDFATGECCQATAYFEGFSDREICATLTRVVQ